MPFVAPNGPVYTQNGSNGARWGVRESQFWCFKASKPSGDLRNIFWSEKHLSRFFSDFWPPRSPLGARPARFQKIPQKWPTRPQKRAKTIRQPQIYFKNGFMALLGLGLGTRLSSLAPPRCALGAGLVNSVCEIKGSLLWKKIFFAKKHLFWRNCFANKIFWKIILL